MLLILALKHKQHLLKARRKQSKAKLSNDQNLSENATPADMTTF